MLERLRDRVLPLAWYEMLLALRSSAGLAAVVVCCVAGILAGGQEGAVPALVGYRVSRLGAILLGFLALPMVAAASRRDSLTRADEVVDVRPQQAHEMLLARWLGNCGAMLALLIVMALFAFGAQLAFGGPLSQGAGAKVSLWAFFDAVCGAFVPLVVLCALAYCAAELLRNVLAAAIVGLYWIFVLLGRDYLSRVFDFSLSQNALVYLLLTATVVLAAMAVVRYRQGLKNARKVNLPAFAALAALCCLGVARHSVLTRHDPPLHLHPVTLEVAGQSIRSNRLPGFWLRDQRGHRTRLAEYEGKRLVVGFWSPAMPDSVKALAAWQRVQDKYADKGVQVIAVCIADDWRVARRFARAAGHTFPMVVDSGTHWAEKIEASSPLAEAYELTGLPTAFVTDEARNLVRRVEFAANGQFDTIDAALGGTPDLTGTIGGP